jgi:hypothetical protein
VHAGIEWQLRTRLGEDAGPEPRLPDAAAWAVESWKDWAQQVALEPLGIERVVACPSYAGTLDLYARVQGILTVLDWKSGKTIYPEAFLQNVAYRHAAMRHGWPSSQGLIVRLPKRFDDPGWEVKFLDRHGRLHVTGKNWTQRHWTWIRAQQFDLAPLQLPARDPRAGGRASPGGCVEAHRQRRGPLSPRHGTARGGE